MTSRSARVAEEIRRRIRLTAALDRDVYRQAAALRYLRTDPVAWTNDWVWTYDPRNRGDIPKRLPLRLWPKQEELVREIVDAYRTGENLLVKKGRAVGGTWIMGAIAAWLLLFEPECSITFGSRKEAYVDKLGDPDAIFPKIRDILAYLPAWQLPPLPLEDGFLLITNPANGSTIKGEAGDNCGRGGRSSLYLFDEHAFLPRADKVDAAITDNSDCVVRLSTSNGIGTAFWRHEHSGASRVFRINYRDNPDLEDLETWRARKLAALGPAAFAQEHEMDDGAAVDNVVIPASWVMDAVGLELEEGGVRAAGLDVADIGSAESVYVSRAGGRVLRLEAWTGADTTETATKAAQFARIDRVGRLTFDGVGVGAGVNGELRRLERTPVGLAFEVSSFLGGGAASETRYDDAPDLTARERFLNARAELWWSLRRRFQRTSEHVRGVRSYPPEELVSIPDDPKLIAQLSSPQWERTEAGKVKIESKDRMRARGVASPDRADALAYAFDAGGVRWWDGVL